MHRTEGDGFVVEGGNNRFKDQALPTYPGTVDTAEYNNAVQEEICNLIELLGGTVEADAATDRANGWRQLYDLLLDDENITDAAMSDFDLEKGFGNIETTFGLYSLLAVPGEVTLHYEAVGADDITIFLSTNPSSPGIGINDEATGCITKLVKGIEFDGGPGESAYENIQYRKAGFRFDLGFSTIVSNGATVGWDWDGVGTHDTDIPFSAFIVGAVLLECNAGGTPDGRVTPVHLDTVNAGGFHRIDDVIAAGIQTGPSGTNVLLIEYDATSL